MKNMIYINENGKVYLNIVLGSGGKGSRDKAEKKTEAEASERDRGRDYGHAAVQVHPGISFIDRQSPTRKKSL